MSALRYPILRVALPVGPARYPRPAVVVIQLPVTRKVLAISSKLDLFRRSEHFLISDDHPDFTATGLSETSYIIGAPVFEVESGEVLGELGQIEGELARAFAKWIE